MTDYAKRIAAIVFRHLITQYQYGEASCSCGQVFDSTTAYGQHMGRLILPTLAEAQAEARLEATEKCKELVERHGDMALGQIRNYRVGLEDALDATRKKEAI